MEAFHQSGGGECFTAKCDEEAFDRCPILVAILIGPATNNTYFLYFFLCLSSPASLRHACKRIWFTRMSMFAGAMAAPSASAFHAPV